MELEIIDISDNETRLNRERERRRQQLRQKQARARQRQKQIRKRRRQIFIDEDGCFVLSASSRGFDCIGSASDVSGSQAEG